MPLPVFEKKEDIPKGFESEYEEKDGKWHPIDREAGLKKALEKEREERDKAEKAAKAAAKAAADAQTALEAKAAGVTDEQLKKIRADAEEAARKEFEPKVKAGEAAAAENRALKLDAVMRKKFADAGILAERLDQIWKLHGTEFDLTADGKPMVKETPAADVDKQVAALAEKYPEWKAGTQASGGGAAGITLPPVGAGKTKGDAVLANPEQALAVAHAEGQK